MGFDYSDSSPKKNKRIYGVVNRGSEGKNPEKEAK